MIMGLNNFGLGLLLTVRDLASPFLKRYTANVTAASAATAAATARMAFGWRSLAGGLLALSGGMAGLYGLKKLTDIAGEFEYEMAGVKVVMKATDEEFVALRKSALDVGFAMTMFDPIQAAQGLRIFAQAGYKAQDAMNALQPTLDMSVASLGQLSLDDSAGLAIAGLKVFGYETERTRELLDKMAQATVMSNMQFKDLPLSLGIVARGAVLVNANLEDTFITLGLIRNVVPTIERGATALATSMEKLAEPKVQEALRGMRVEVDAGGGKFRNFLDIVGDVTVALAKMTPIQRGAATMQLFSKRSMSGMIVVMKQLRLLASQYKGDMKTKVELAIKDLRKQMAEGTGVMERFRDTVLDTWKGQGQALAAAGKTWGVVFGEPLAKAFKPVTKTVVELMTALSKTFETFDEKTKKVIMISVWLVAFIGVVTGLVLSIAGLIALISAVGLSLTSLGLIVGGIVATVVTLIGTIWTLKKAWQANVLGIKDFVLPIWERVYTGIKALIQVIRNFDGEWTYMTKDVSDSLNELGMDDFKKFVITVSMYMHRLTVMFEGVKEGWDHAMMGTRDYLEPLKDSIVFLFDQISYALWQFSGGLGEHIGLLDESTDGWEGFGKVLGKSLAMTVQALGLVLYALTPLIYVFGGLIRAISLVVTWWKELAFVLAITNPFGALIAPILAVILLWDVVKYVFAEGMKWLVDNVVGGFIDILKEINAFSEEWFGRTPFDTSGMEQTMHDWSKSWGETAEDWKPERYGGEGAEAEAKGTKIGKPGKLKVLPRRFVTKPIEQKNAPASPFSFSSPEVAAAAAAGAAVPGALPVPLLVQVVVDSQIIQEALYRKAKQNMAVRGSIAAIGKSVEAAMKLW